MSTATETTTTDGIDLERFGAGVAGSLVGGVLFGLVMQFIMSKPVLEMAIPAMYGIEGPALAVGWGIHLFYAVVLGLVYVAVVEFTPLQSTASSTVGAVALGIGYGIVTTLVLAVVVMPLWLQGVGFGGAPPFPNVAIPGTIVSTLGHVLYAVPVALAYAAVANGR